MTKLICEFPRDNRGNKANRIVIKTECVCNGMRISSGIFGREYLEKGIYLKTMDYRYFVRKRVTEDGGLEDIKLPKLAAFLPFSLVKMCTETAIKVFKISGNTFYPVPKREVTTYNG